MALTVTKKTRTILLIILGVLVVGSGGFLIWRVTREDTVAPEDSEAGGCTGDQCCICGTDKKHCPGGDCNYSKCVDTYGCCGCWGWDDKRELCHSCSYYGRCGTLNGESFSYTQTSWPEGTFCSLGTTIPANPAFPGAGGTRTWKCEGEGGSDSGQTCSASREAAPLPPPTCGANAKDYGSNATGWVGPNKFCGNGTIVGTKPAFPDLGDSVDWYCQQSTYSNKKCTATVAESQDPDCGSRAGQSYAYDITSWSEAGGTFCSTGTVVGGASSVSFPEERGDTTWQCKTPGKAATNCSASRNAPPTPVCGSHAGSYPYGTSGWTSGNTWCSRGTPSNTPNFPEPEQTVNWKCLTGETGETNCSASQAGASCGDGICDVEENVENCPADCDDVCGDGYCTGDEDENNCSEDCGTSIPQTGLLDSVVGRIFLGLIFIILGGTVSQYSRINYFYQSVTEKHRFRQEIRKQKRIVRRREKLEDSFS